MSPAVIGSRARTIRYLVETYALAYADAAIITDYAADRGPHHITGTAKTLHYLPGGGWLIEGAA